MAVICDYCKKVIEEPNIKLWGFTSRLIKKYHKDCQRIAKQKRRQIRDKEKRETTT